MADPDAHVAFGEDDPVRADALKDASVRLGDRLGHDLLDAEVDEDARREDARLEVGADGDDGGRELGDPELPHRLLARRVGLDDVGEHAGEVLDDPRVRVDAEHFVAHADERGGEAPAEAAEPDDDELPGCLSQ